MAKSFIFILLMLIICEVGFTQTKKDVDSLENQLAHAKDDTSRINCQIKLCRLYRLGNTDSSLMYGKAALESANNIGYIRGQISALAFICIALEQRGDLPKSLESGFKALQLAEEHHLEILSRPALAGISEVYIILGEYSTAISYLRRGISIGINEQGLPVSLIGGDVQGLAYSYWDMGVALAGLNQLESAGLYEERAIEAFHKYNYEEPLVYQTLGDISVKKSGISKIQSDQLVTRFAMSDDLERALAYYQKSLQISIEKNERRASAYAYNKIAELYRITNKPDFAIDYARKGLQESLVIGQKRTIYQAATLLSGLYEPSDLKESLRYLKMANAYNDSLFGAGNMQAVQVLAAQQNEHKKEILNARVKYKERLKQYILLAGLVSVLVIALILYRNSRQKQKANKVLENTLTHLKSTQQQLIQSEKMASLGELTAGIAHEIQNPLNFVNNFSDVNGELLEELKVEADEGNLAGVKAIATDLVSNEQKIKHHGKRADAIVKGMLQHSRTSSGQKEPTDVNKIVDEYLRLAYQGFRARDKSFNATFTTEFDSGLGNLNVVPQEIGRVILNLINNAFYAVNERAKEGVTGYEPIVIVGTKRLQDRIEISLRDSGNGIPGSIKEKIFQPFFTTKPTGQGTGLGLSLSYDIIKAHGGEIKVETKEGEGSEFIIQLPVDT